MYRLFCGDNVMPSSVSKITAVIEWTAVKKTGLLIQAFEIVFAVWE